jgi:Adenylate cyclase, family 3 (some proteins contain HAMP domain)
MDQPDEVRPYEGGRTEIFEMAEFVIGRMIMEPGWTWQKNVRPIAGTDRCMYHHLGYVLSGRLGVRMPDGSEAVMGPDEMYEIPPGHDAWVIGDEAWVAIDFRGARSYARPIAASGDRILATILFTDIVDSTKTLERVGDAAWADLLAQHHELLTFELDRYRGREINKTGDGIVAVFDGPARAVECAASMVRRVRETGLEIRAGLHTGEIELVPGDIRGMAVHLAARIMGLAGPGEVLISGVTRDLLAGAGHTFESRGRHQLKGIDDEREVFALAT